MNEILRTRKNLILQLTKEFSNYVTAKTGHILDEHDIEIMIDMWLPMTYAEHEVEWEETKKTTPQKPGPMTVAVHRIRKLLNLPEKAGLTETLEKAVAVLEMAKFQQSWGR